MNSAPGICTALTIAGSDCSGGAGVQADLKTFSANGVFGMSVITSVVAENTSRVLSIRDLDAEIIRDQMQAVFEDMPVNAVKIGMLSNAGIMETVADGLRDCPTKRIVLDPVMIAKGGQALMDPGALDVLKERLFPLAKVITPNIPEAVALTGLSIGTPAQMEEAARRLHALGPRCVLVKGGHAAGDALDLLFDGERVYTFTHARIATKNTHGTGCTLSSAIAANLAKGMDVPAAVEAAKAYVTEAIAHALPLGHGHGPTHHFYELYRRAGLIQE